MKTRTRISALLLVICLLAGMAVPMVSADAEQAIETVTYDFDYNTIRQKAGITEKDNGFTNAVVQGHLNNTLYGNYINWKCYDHKQTSTFASLFNNTDKGHLEFRSAENDWVAFDIENPGVGQWDLSFVGYDSKSIAREVEVYIIKKTDTVDVSASMTEDNLVETLQFTSTSSTEKEVTKDFAQGYNFEENEKYIVALKAKTKTTATDGFAGRAWICLKELRMTKSCADAVAEINDAILGSTIALQSEVTTDAQLNLGNGVTLDLNGQTLNAGNLKAIKGAHVIDSSTSDSGVLCVTGSMQIDATNKEMPLKTENGGYRFFTFTLTSQDVTDYNKENDSAKFWFNLHFDNTDAYDLIAGGNSGLKIYARLGWDGLNGGKYATPEDAFYGQWAAAASEKPNVSINITVIGLSKVKGFNLMPNVQANGLNLMGSAIAYTAA